jgi:hypothetical protein
MWVESSDGVRKGDGEEVKKHERLAEVVNGKIQTGKCWGCEIV